jgi:hypothetical protein
MAPLWEQCDDCAEGQHAVKAKEVLYLRPLSPLSARYGVEDYKDYLHRAVFYNVTGNTVEAIVGALLRKDPSVNFPVGTNLDSIGYGGETLSTMMRSSASQVVRKGRVGHLVDAGKEGLPYVTEYRAESIIWWAESVIEERSELSFVVLREISSDVNYNVDFTQQPLESVDVTRFRVLSLETVDGEVVYRQRLYRQVLQDKGEIEIILDQDIFPTQAGGRTLNYIPFRITGPATEASADPQKPPILALSDTNLAHYRNSADLEHGAHYTAMPTPFVAGITVEGTELRMGSRTAWLATDPAAHAEMVEFEGAGLGTVLSMMDAKKSEMAILGARLFEDTSNAASGEALAIRQAGNRSVLASIADSLSTSWTWLLDSLWSWQSTLTPEEPVSVRVNADYSASGLSAQQLVALMQQVQAGLMSWDVYFYNVEKAELYPRGHTREEEADSIAAGTPLPAGVPRSSSPAVDDDDTEDAVPPDPKKSPAASEDNVKEKTSVENDDDPNAPNA